MKKACASLALCVAVSWLFAGSASAQFGIAALDGAISDQGGSAFTKAGGHPDSISVALEMNTSLDPLGRPLPDGQIKDLHFSLPPGLLGNAITTPACPGTDALLAFACPHFTQVGIARLKLNSGVPFLLSTPVYVIRPPLGVTARFGLQINGTTPILFDARLGGKGGDRLALDVSSASQLEPLLGAVVTLWGTPAASGHDQQRCVLLVPEFDTCIGEPGSLVGPNPAGVLPTAFLTEPTSCTPDGVGLPIGLHAESWQDPAQAADAEFFTHVPPSFEALSLSEPPLPPASRGPQQGPTGCAQVPFDPEVSITPTTTAADSPTGLRVDISLPSDGIVNPLGVTQSQPKKAVITLPEGMTVNPASAQGLGGCSVAQLAEENPKWAPGEGCPDDSKIGTVELDTPILADQLHGSVYLATPYENPFNSLFAIYIVLKSAERGVAVKLEGAARLDPRTGQLTISFEDLPQLPFSEFHLSLRGGSRAPLVTPNRCGKQVTAISLAPWSRPENPVTVNQSMAVSSGPNGDPCPKPGQFDARFRAGTITPIAGGYSPLVVKASRSDGSEPLTGLNLDLPEGLLARLAGASACAEAALEGAASRAGHAELASSSCPAASKVGTVDVGAGAGSTPFHVQGTAYLAGPYKGAPISLVVITPAVAGPFDLGTVVVRAKADVDPSTTQIHVVSDPIPQILQGIPLKVRSVSVNTDRPGFTLNPTSCEPFAFSGTLFGTSVSKPVSNRFQVGACNALGFKPKLSLKLSGPTGRSKNPALRAVLTQPPGQANIDRLSVVLPKSAFIDNAHISNPCTRAQFNANACPKQSILGTAIAHSSLLDKPLRGEVYFRSNGGTRTLPDLVADLNGQIHITLVGYIDAVNGRVRARFPAVPDAPVSKLVLSLGGGGKGLIENAENICRKPQRASIDLTAHNGRLYDTKPLIARAGC